MLVLGSHISAQGKNGIQDAILHAEKIGANCLQIFVSNRVGRGTKKILKKEVDEISSMLAQKKIILFIHSPYVINFAKEFSESSWWIQLYKKELNIAHEIGAYGCVIHMGKGLGGDVDITNDLFISSIKYFAKHIIESNLTSKVILETPAGQGTEMYSTIEAFIKMYNSFSNEEKKVVKICVDTCHVFSTNYNPEDYLVKIVDKVGIKNVCLIHLNDSKKDKGSCVDRHENIGKGFIPHSSIVKVVKFAKEHHIPMILETPDIDLHAKEIAELSKV